MSPAIGLMTGTMPRRWLTWTLDKLTRNCGSDGEGTGLTRTDETRTDERTGRWRRKKNSVFKHLRTSAWERDLLVPWSRTSLSQNRAFAVVGPALWNDIPPALRSVMLQGISSASLRSLKTFLFTCLSRWERLWIAFCERRYTNIHIT